MHGLASYAQKLGLVDSDQQTAKFAQLFWNNLAQKGRVNELRLGMALYFMNGLGEGVKMALKMKDIGLNLAKTKRMNPLEILGGHGLKDLAGFKKMVAKAQALEDARIKQNNA
jgi:quinone-modifying oxidoreductase subunit QmoC